MVSVVLEDVAYDETWHSAGLVAGDAVRGEQCDVGSGTVFQGQSWDLGNATGVAERGRRAVRVRNANSRRREGS